MWVPVPGGPAFLLGPNFYAVRSYNPSMNYALAICHLGDRILGAPPFIQPFPGSERALTLAEVQEMQTRLTKAGFDTGGTDGRVGNDTMKAVKDYQTKMGLLPADGYGGLKVLARLRQGSCDRELSERERRASDDECSQSTRLPDHRRPLIRHRDIDHPQLHALGALPAIDRERSRDMQRLAAILRSARCRASGRSSETRCR